MSSTEINTCEDTRNRPAFPLPPELRLRVYEQLLVHPTRRLKPSGYLLPQKGRPHDAKDHICINILLTCRTFYDEALPILYGRNTLVFHDSNFTMPVLSFPERYLTMIKRADVYMSPCFYGSAEKMGNFLMALGTSGAKLIDLLIFIHLAEDDYEYGFENLLDNQCRPPAAPRSLFDQDLFENHPIVTGLFSLKRVKNFVIQLADKARLEPGIADMLKEAFMKDGTIDGRSITIKQERIDSHKAPHKALDDE